jgi:Magnesium chelatase, subunit ChlI
VADRDLADVAGQPQARRAAEICAAGGHHLLLRSRPGLGRTPAGRAHRATTARPVIGRALEVTAIRSLADALTEPMPLVTRPPFIAPPHIATIAAIIGGGSGIIRPGAASLAHCGCLFLDCAPEFDRCTLDAPRQPVETGNVTIARAWVTARLPGPVHAGSRRRPVPVRRRSCGPAELRLQAADAWVSIRKADRIVALWWTPADLAGSGRPGGVRSALGLRLGIAPSPPATPASGMPGWC